MPLTLGQILQNRYRIDDLLGQGGMGAVYLAWDLNLNTPAVVKENLGHSPEAQKQFAREAGLLASLRHPNLPRVTDYFFLPGQGQYLVMDYIEGEDLREILDRHRAVSEAQALAWVCCVLDALYYLHGRRPQPVIHRDIKPANIKICPDGQVFLVDFGLAKVYDPLVSTTSGAQALTPGFAPPEQYGAGRTDARTDIYSVGATLYALLTGDAPPDALHLVTGGAHLPSPEELSASMSPQLAAAVLRAMQVRPADRFQTVAELRGELVACQAAQEAAERARREAEREAQRQAAARERQQRLANSFAQAERQLSHDPAQSLALLDAIRAEQADYPNLARLEARARAALAMRKKQEEEALRQRERERRKQEADGAVAARQWAQALTLAATLEGMGGSGRALAGEIRKAVQRGQQLENRERQERLDARAAEVRAIVDRDPKQALQLLAQLRQDAPNHPALAGLERRAQSVLTEQAKRAQAALDREQRGELEPQASPRLEHPADRGPLRLPWRTVALWACLAVPLLALLISSPWWWSQLFSASATPTISVATTPTVSIAIAEGATPSPQQPLTLVPTSTPTWTATLPPTPSATLAPSHTPTPSRTPTPSATPAPSHTPTPSATPTSGRTPLPSATPTPAPIRSTPTQTAALKTEPPPPSGSYTGNLAFAVYNAGSRTYTLYTVKPDGSGLHGLADHVHHPDYSPNGRRIVVDGTGGGREDLWHFASDGSDWRQLTTHPDDHYPTWSPNGVLVAFSSTRQGDGNYWLYVNDEVWEDNRGIHILGDYPVYMPTWELVFSGCDYGWGLGSNCGLWRVASGGEPAQITGVPRDIPTDANETEILFLRPDENDNWDLYRVARTGGNPIRLTDDPARDGPAAFSPDGQAIAFLSDRSGTWALYLMSRAGTNERKIVDLPAGGGYDASPNGWNTERISWGALPVGPAPASPTPDLWLTAPHIDFPIPDDTINTNRPTIVRWSWSGVLASGQGFDLRFWHASDPGPQGVAPPTQERQMEIDFSMTSAYLAHGQGFYYLDVVVVQIEPYRVLSRSAPIRVKLPAR